MEVTSTVIFACCWCGIVAFVWWISERIAAGTEKPALCPCRSSSFCATSKTHTPVPENCRITAKDLPALFVGRVRGDLQAHLLKMVDIATSELQWIDQNATRPAIDSHVFSALCNTFGALDILSVALSGEHDAQFFTTPKVNLITYNCADNLIESFVDLQNTAFSGVVKGQPTKSFKYTPRHLWASYKRNGVGMVALLHDDETRQYLRFGKVVTPRAELENYIASARSLILLASM